jgi:protease-4
MKHNSFITELIRGQWLIDNPEAYFELAENFRNRMGIDFQSKYSVEEKALEILDATGFPISSKDGQVNVPKNAIAQVRLQGEILPYSNMCVSGSDEIVNQLFKAQELSNVDATIFKINSPGGSTQAADDFREFGKYKTKPVVGLVRDGLSLGYLAAIACCDYIMLDGDFSSRVGSIGVVATLRDNTKALEDAGIKIHEIYPPESNFKNKDVQDAKNGDYKGMIKNALSPLAIAFKDYVVEKRPNLIQEPGVLNGAVYYGKEALRLGLIDGIGDSRMALQKARELAMKAKFK